MEEIHVLGDEVQKMQSIMLFNQSKAKSTATLVEFPCKVRFKKKIRLFFEEMQRIKNNTYYTIYVC